MFTHAENIYWAPSMCKHSPRAGYSNRGKMDLCPRGVYRLADKNRSKSNGLSLLLLRGYRKVGTVWATRGKREWEYDAPFVEEVRPHSF